MIITVADNAEELADYLPQDSELGGLEEVICNLDELERLLSRVGS